MHFGVRKTFVTDEDQRGITIINIAPTDESETRLGQLIHDRTERGLRYEIPDVRDVFEKACLSNEMISILSVNIDHDLMTEDLIKVWYELGKA